MGLVRHTGKYDNISFIIKNYMSQGYSLNLVTARSISVRDD